MASPRVAIITRALNRLEYTALCVRGINSLAGFGDYEHIVIDQASTDGTGAWLRSLEVEGYYKIRPIYNAQNSGDAGGMADGLAAVSNSCEYVMQFDNDCEPLTPDFLKNLVKIMDADGQIGAIMLKREGVFNVLVPETEIQISGLRMGVLPKNKALTCCTIMRRQLVLDSGILFSGAQIRWVQSVTRWMIQARYACYKCMDIRVNHIDGSALQDVKYKKYCSGKTVKGSNYTEANYVR
jgi:glycosyltransferase involved in cell wall biosynthesis